VYDLQGGIMSTGYVAFLDVLGFSSLVSGDFHAERIDKYLECLSTIFNAKKGRPLVEYVVFSDSLILTTMDDSDASFQALAARCSCLFGALLENEIAIRGAISHGSFISSKTESGTFVAGRAIIEAYQFEGKQDWVGIMVAPSVIRKIPDLAERCLYEDPHSIEILRRLTDRLLWAAHVQPCNQIPFHGSPLENSTYRGFAIVPSDGSSDLAALRDSLTKSLERLSRLESLAPDPRAQGKYQRTYNWLNNVRSNWGTAVFRRGQLPA
jgi:hypothetical protein